MAMTAMGGTIWSPEELRTPMLGGGGKGSSCAPPLPSQVDRAVALSRLRQSGAFLTTSESVVLQLLRDSRHPRFRQVKPRPLPGRPRPPRCSAPPTEAHATRRS